MIDLYLFLIFDLFEPKNTMLGEKPFSNNLSSIILPWEFSFEATKMKIIGLKLLIYFLNDYEPLL